jgi:hypothetical protein
MTARHCLFWTHLLGVLPPKKSKVFSSVPSKGYAEATSQNQKEAPQIKVGESSCGYLTWAFAQNVVPRETQAPLWGWLTARSGLMPNNDCCRLKAIEPQNALWEPLFFFREARLAEQIGRRDFVSLGLAAPIGAVAAGHRVSSTALSPVSMGRCVVVTKGRDRPSPIWHCEIGHESEHWWLIISPTETGQPHLTVIQPPSAVPENAGLLTARITFRLHVLQRRGLAQGFTKRHLVMRVNRQILRAMENLPV